MPVMKKAEKSCVYIKGLKGISKTDRYNENPKTAFNKGKAIMDALPSSINEEQLFNTFDDYQIIEIDGKKRYLVNLTWYVLGEVTFDTTSEYYLSFGKTHKKLGVNFDFYNTNLIGITEGAKVNAADSFWVMQGSNDDEIDNPFNIENVEINCANKVIVCEYGDARFVLNINNCKFDNLMYISQGSKMSIKIKNSIFKVANDSDYALIIERDDYQEVGTKLKEDTIIIENNKFFGTNNYKCLNLNDPYCNKGIINNNLFKDFHTKSISGEKKGNSIIQFSQGVNYEVCNNTFDNCKCNVFMIHEDLLTTSKVNLLINNNTIDNCSYVGVNETGSDDTYHLVSSGNIITNTSEKECYLDNTLCSENDTDTKKYIFYINKTIGNK